MSNKVNINVFMNNFNAMFSFPDYDGKLTGSILRQEITYSFTGWVDD